MLALSHITRRFGPLTAVDDVSLTISPGEIVALAGENGAGKTTLMRIAAGEIAANAGTVERGAGVGFVHQHFMLVDDFSIAENLALALDIDAGDAPRVIEDSGIVLPGPARRVADLSVGERSKVELVKAIARKPEVLILDEPTSVLTPTESEELFCVMRAFAERGTAIVFISHKIPEVMRVATRFVVMRQGRVVADEKQMTAEELAQAMIGSQLQTPDRPPAQILRSRSGLEPALHIDNLEVHANEIVAIIGVAGNGQSELASRLRKRFRTSAGFIPEDRTRDGIVAEMSVAENFALATTANPVELIRRYDIRTRGTQQLAGTLSGGNQQKLVLARELSREPAIVVAAEPSRGLDIEATRFVHEQLRAAAARGAAVLLLTSDLDEAFALADALHVIYRGRLSERLTPAEASERAASLMAGIAS